MIDSNQDEAVKREAGTTVDDVLDYFDACGCAVCKERAKPIRAMQAALALPPANLNAPDKQEALAAEGVEYPADAIDQLVYHQTQLDPDGCMVGVSRQAIDEVIAYVHCALSRTPSSPQADVERVARAISPDIGWDNPDQGWMSAARERARQQALQAIAALAPPPQAQVE